MESNRNQNAVERKLKEAVRNDRARIQIGSISQFGLLDVTPTAPPQPCRNSIRSLPPLSGDGTRQIY